jgi:hypothetical protein
MIINPQVQQLSSLTRTFTVNGDPGNYQISLQLSSLSASEFSTPSALSVNLLDVNTPPPPPGLTLVRLFDSVPGAIALFDISTDCGSTIPSLRVKYWKCDNLFVFGGAFLSTCSWLNSSAVQIITTPDPVSYLDVGMSMAVLPGRLKAACSAKQVSACEFYAYSNSTSALVLLPLNPMVPQVVLDAPNIISSCQDLVIQATSSRGGFYLLTIIIVILYFS